MNIEKKLKSIEESCIETAHREAQELEAIIRDTSNIKLNEKLETYKKDLAKKYEKEVNRLEKEYNMDVYDYEQSQKIRINQFQESLMHNIKTKVETAMIQFTNSETYKSYLISHIKNTMKKAYAENEKCKVLIVEKDYYQYKNEILQIFPIMLERINNDYIGGCMVINEKNKISIDNTIKTNIDQLGDQLGTLINVHF